MLEQVDLKQKVSRADYKAVKPELDIRLGVLQRRARELGVPVSIVFEGWSASGKGTLINELILPLDPRGFSVRVTRAPNEEESRRPFLWRFWCDTPARGRIAIFDRSWYRHLLEERFEEKLKRAEIERACRDIRAFERQLADAGHVLIKLFLHISGKEQKKRLRKLQDNPLTAWRVTRDDWKRHRQYARYAAAFEDMFGETDSDFAPWTIVEAHHERFATLKIFRTVIAALERGIAAAEKARTVKAAAKTGKPDPSAVSMLGGIDLSAALGAAEYKRRLKRGQERLHDLQHEVYVRRIPVLVAYEGWDAAGKGGNIRRLTRELDPRGYEVVPVAAPNDIEKAHHYLWRFWMQMPKAGHITIFDRTWYGRVLVERVEGFCSPREWRRAFREINEMERHLTDYGAVLVKFWLQIDADEQLRRFEAREKTDYKRWKITPEDWRNREKWDLYQAAVEEMLYRSSPPSAPWTIVESNNKWFARVKTVETVIDAIEQRLKAAEPPS